MNATILNSVIVMFTDNIVGELDDEAIWVSTSQTACTKHGRVRRDVVIKQQSLTEWLVTVWSSLEVAGNV